MDFFDLTDGPDSRTFNLGEVAGKPVRALGGSDTITGSGDNEDINGNLGDDIISGGAAMIFCAAIKATTRCWAVMATIQ